MLNLPTPSLSSSNMADASDIAIGKVLQQKTVTRFVGRLHFMYCLELKLIMKSTVFLICDLQVDVLASWPKRLA